MSKVGILGVGMFLPMEVRHNDWWSAELVASWMERRRAAPPPPSPRTEGEARVLAAMKEQALDPFQGAVERRVIAADMTALDMEEAAAREAIERGGVAAGEIDLLLTHTVVPEYWLGNPACELHARLGLPTRCFAMHVDAAAYSFLMQLGIAEAMIRAGQARYGLLVQSCAASRVIDLTDPGAPIFGDAATAVLVGPVSGSRGVLASVHHADGTNPRSLIATVPGGRWYDEGRVTIHIGDPAQMREVFLQTADACKTSVDATLARAGHTPADVDVLCMYQGTPWLRRVVQDYAGLSRARSIETFARTGYICSALVPAGLYFALAEGQLRDDDLVVATGGGTGMTYGATAMRWGR